MNAIGCVGSSWGLLNNSSGAVNNAWDNARRLGEIIQPFKNSWGQGQEAMVRNSWGQGGGVPEMSGHINLCA
jgi:hypothetical protein